MIVHENTIYGPPDEIAMLKQSASFDDTRMEEVSEAFMALANALNVATEELSKLAEEVQEAKQELKPFRCRICGSHFYSKGEAKSCTRSHNSWRK